MTTTGARIDNELTDTTSRQDKRLNNSLIYEPEKKSKQLLNESQTNLHTISHFSEGQC